MRAATLTPVARFETLTLDERGTALAKRLSALGIPGNKTEQYKHFGIKPLLTKVYCFTDAEQLTPPVKGDTLEITNGIVTSAPQGVSLTFDTDFAPATEHYDALYFLSHLLVPHTIVLTVETDTVLNITHRLTKAKSLLPYRIVVQTAPKSNVSVYETFTSTDSDESLVLYGLDVAVGKEASLTWIRNQTIDENEATVIGSHHYALSMAASLRLQTFDFGSGNALHLYQNDLEEDADAAIDHLLFAYAKAHRGNVIHLRHRGEKATVVHRAKSLVKERATGIFDGLIRVDNTARFTSAHQHSQAILLNDGAFMYAKPQLEIYIDELEASHGSTTGQLDEAALFYLRSRGISFEEARKMLILAFANEMIEAVEDKTVAVAVTKAFETTYYTKETL